MRRLEIPASARLEDIDLRRVRDLRIGGQGRRKGATDYAPPPRDRRGLSGSRGRRPAMAVPSRRSLTGHTMNIEKPFRRVVAAGLDVRQVVRQTLRHTAITHLVQAGVDLPTVQRIY